MTLPKLGDLVAAGEVLNTVGPNLALYYIDTAPILHSNHEASTDNSNTEEHLAGAVLAMDTHILMNRELSRIMEGVRSIDGKILRTEPRFEIKSSEDGNETLCVRYRVYVTFPGPPALRDIDGGEFLKNVECESIPRSNPEDWLPKRPETP